MGYKRDDACLAKVTDDEPIFVLRSTDRMSHTFLHFHPATNSQWCEACSKQLPIDFHDVQCPHCEAMLGGIAVGYVRTCNYCQQPFLPEWNTEHKYCSAYCNRVGEYPRRIFTLEDAARPKRWAHLYEGEEK